MKYEIMMNGQFFCTYLRQLGQRDINEIKERHNAEYKSLKVRETPEGSVTEYHFQKIRGNR